VRILVFGGWGQLGTELAAAGEAREHQIFRPTREEADVIDFRAVAGAIRDARPDLVVNAAAFHRVESCEKDPTSAFSVNSLGAVIVARMSCHAGARNAFVSTDYVFDGEKGRAYNEDDRPNPVNLYGVSKAAGERGVRLSCPNSFVIRTSGLFGHAGSSGKGGNFVETMISRAEAGLALSVVDDQRLAPTAAADLAERILLLAEAEAEPGIYHLTNRGSCSWFELAGAILELAGIEADLSPRKTGEDEDDDEVRRPWNTALADTRTAAFGLPRARSWRAALAWYLEARDGRRLPRSAR
jgi:dTDP-4-dehydrorhamnose reductase